MKKLLLPILFFTSMLMGCESDYAGAMQDPEPDGKMVKLDDINISSMSVLNGTYDVEAYVRGTKDNLLIIEANGRKCAAVLKGDVWSLVRVKSVEITDGKLSMKSSVLNTTDKYELKAAYLKSADYRRPIIKGGDFSMLTQVENNGGKYYDIASTKAEDCIALSARNGMNLARLRLYNNPGTIYTEGIDNLQMFSGIQDEEDVLRLAKRAKEAGMQIELTFHYSDYWTNGGTQYKPTAWQNYSKDELHSAVYTYTRDFLKKMNAQGTTPEYVSLGNEIQSGILFGKLDEENNMPSDSLTANGYCSDMKELAELLNEGSKAVREVCPQAKIILHLTTGTTINFETYKWFFTAMSNYQADYDIIGASYYPNYGNYSIETVINWANQLTAIYDKDWLFMETGFAWSNKLQDGTMGQIYTNMPYENMTPQAQLIFMNDLTEAIYSASPRILGYIYWDPIYIAAPNCGYAVGQKNVTGNSTLYDYDGVALPAWNALKYNN